MKSLSYASQLEENRTLPGAPRVHHPRRGSSRRLAEGRRTCHTSLAGREFEGRARHAFGGSRWANNSADGRAPAPTVEARAAALARMSAPGTVLDVSGWTREALAKTMRMLRAFFVVADADALISFGFSCASVAALLQAERGEA